MKVKLYSAADPMQAHVLRGALEAAGIEAEVRRDALFNTRGESPVTFDTLPEVWIAEDADLTVARGLVAQLASPTEPQGEPWRCAHCGEYVEGHFGACWNCSQSR